MFRSMQEKPNKGIINFEHERIFGKNEEGLSTRGYAGQTTQQQFDVLLLGKSKWCGENDINSYAKLHLRKQLEMDLEFATICSRIVHTNHAFAD